MEIDFEKIYRVTITALRLNRSHPEVPKDMKWALQFGIQHGIFTLTYICMAYNIALVLEVDDYTEAIRHGVSSVVYFVVSFQYFILVLKQNTILKLMNTIKDDFKKSMTYDEKMIVLEHAEKGGYVCKQWFTVCFITAALFPVKHLIFEIYLYMKGEFRLVMQYPLTFPSPIEENKYHPFIYTVTYIMHILYVAYGACGYISFVPLGPSFMLHACGQLEIVKRKASDVFSNPEEIEVKRKLIEIVKHLQLIYSFIDCVRGLFKVVYEISLKASVIMVPVALYQVLLSLRRGECDIEFITFIFAGIFFSSTPCYYSEMLIQKGEDVRLAIYTCGWEAKYDHKARMTILVILLRTLRPTSIQSMFRTVCLEALADVMRQAYTIFSLMNAAWS